MIQGILLSVFSVACFIEVVLYYIDYTCTISSKLQKKIIPGQEGNAYKRTQKNHFGFGVISACMALALFLDAKDYIVYSVGVLVCICFGLHAYKEEKEYYM